MKRIRRHIQLHRATAATRKHGRAVRRRLAKVGSNNTGSHHSRSRITPPDVLDFDENYDETVAFFSEMKRALLHTSDGARRVVAVDLAKIKSLTLGAALVLAAEIDRWRVMRATRLAPQMQGWSPAVLQTLQQLNFFELLAVKSPPRVPNKVRTDVTVLPLVGCDTANGALVKAISDHLRKAAEILDQNPVVYEAMFEAAYNSTLHAYPKDYPFKFPPIRNRWWATASWSHEKGELSFMVFDQGVGIAETLPRWNLYERFVSFLASLAPPGATSVFKEHAMMISAALEVSRTSREGGHGQGLCDIANPIDTLNAGRLRILSGRGEVLYLPGNKKVLRDRELHIGGTLIEWVLPVAIR